MLRETLAGLPREPDLADLASWQQAYERDGRKAEGVIISACGRYTIVRIPPGLVPQHRFQAFRRHGPPEQTRLDPPSWSAVHLSADEARRSCRDHAALEVAA